MLHNVKHYIKLYCIVIHVRIYLIYISKYNSHYCCTDIVQIMFFCIDLRAFIFFAPALSSGKSSVSSSGPCSGEIIKSSVEVFHGENKFAIFRKDTGIPGSFKDDVRAEMKKTPEYNLLTNNCIHFALELLHVDSEVMHLFIFNVTNNPFKTYSHDYE